MRLELVIDAKVGEGLSELVAQHALAADVMSVADVERIRAEMAEAQAGKTLQPHYMRAFFEEVESGPTCVELVLTSGAPVTAGEQAAKEGGTMSLGAGEVEGALVPALVAAAPERTEDAATSSSRPERAARAINRGKVGPCV